MADFAIGDIQGCYDPLMRLLDAMQFNDQQDTLWFVGDLVNRGPQSLAVLRFVRSLARPPRITLGNHDLHLINTIFGTHPRRNNDDTLDPILKADDCEELGHWLRSLPILIHEPSLNLVMVHAGIAPSWTLNAAKAHATELEKTLSGPHFRQFLENMYGNTPNAWTEALTGMTRLRVICNYFTRMRFCDDKGRLVLNYKGTLKDAPPGLYPWYNVPNRQEINADIIFGHWAALGGQCTHPRIYALDTGCYWGGQLTALRLSDRQRFAVPGESIETSS